MTRLEQVGQGRNGTLVVEGAFVKMHEGYAAVGYEYLSMDDCWGAQQRGPKGELRADPTRFPGGLKPLGDFLHAKGLRFGTCERHLGSPVCPLAPAPNGSACAAQAAACIV